MSEPPRYIVYAGGRRETNPAWVAYKEAQNPAIAAKKAEAAKAFAEAGVEIKSPGVLDRTVADIRSGKRSVPTSQLNPEQREQLLTAQLRDRARAGELTPAQYQQKLAEITGGYEKESGERTEYLGRIAQTAGRSETVKQDEARAIAAQQGVAIGTIDKSGAANLSANSIEFKNRQVSEFANAQKNQMAQQAQVTQQKDQRVVVTTPDGRERTFKNLEAAEKFVKRTEGSYVKEIQGPQRDLPAFVKNAFYTYDDIIGPPDLTFTGAYGEDFFVKGEVVGKVSLAKTNKLPLDSNPLINELKTNDFIKGSIGYLFNVNEKVFEKLQQDKLKKDDRWFSSSIPQLLMTGTAANQIVLGFAGNTINLLEQYVVPPIRKGTELLVDRYKQSTTKALGEPAPASLLLEKMIIPSSYKPTPINLRGTTADTDIIPVTDSLQIMSREQWQQKQSEFIEKKGVAVYVPQIVAGYGLGVESIPGLVKTVAPKLAGISPIKVLKPALDDTIIYKGIGLQIGKNRPAPLIGVSGGKIIFGEKSLAEPIITSMKNTGRYGGEIVLQTSPSGQLLVSQKTIDDLISSGFINKVSGIRADVRQQATFEVQTSGKTFAGTLLPSESKQPLAEAEHISKTTKALQESGDIDVVGGSPVLISSLSPEIKRQFPYFVKYSDFDIHPLLRQSEIKRGVTLEQKADWVLDQYLKDYPIPEGAKLETTRTLGKNRQLNILESEGKKRKPLEVVMINAKEQPLSGISGITQKDSKTFILQYELKNKDTKFTAEYNIETFTLKDQELTNVKTGLNLRDWELTAGKSSWISGLRTSDVQFHHLIKKGPQETGILLTRREHLGITALQGQLGKIQQPKGAEIVLDLIGERKGKFLPPQHEQKLAEYLSVAENRMFVQNVLEEAASQIKDPKKFKGKPLSNDPIKLSQKIMKRPIVFGEPVEYKSLKISDSVFDYGIGAKIKNKLSLDDSISNIRFSVDDPETWAFRFQGNTKDVFLNTGLEGGMRKIQEEKIADIIAHETTHNVLEKLVSKEASTAFDNLVYAHYPTVEKVQGLTRGKIIELSVPTIKQNDLKLAEMIPKEKIKFEEEAIRWQELDQPAKKMLYPQHGREAKDTARDLIATYQTAWNKQQQMGLTGAVKTQKIAEKFESVYPEINFRGIRDTPRNIRFVDNETNAKTNMLRSSIPRQSLTNSLLVTKEKNTEPPSMTSKPPASYSRYTTQKPTSYLTYPKLTGSYSTPTKTVSITQIRTPLISPSRILSTIKKETQLKTTNYNIISSKPKSEPLRTPTPKSIKEDDYPFLRVPQNPIKITPVIKTPPLIKNPPTTRPPSNFKLTSGSRRSFTQPERKAGLIILDIKNTTKKKEGIFDKSHNFLGWTKVAEIGGARTTTKDIDVGDKRTAKLYEEDILGTKRRYKKSDKVLSKNLLGKNNRKSLI